ncbi:MAG: TRAP transporter small permease [Bacillota bacterium]
MGKGERSEVLLRVAETLGIMGIIAIAALTALQVVLRYVFRSPLLWAEEIVRLISAWTIFIGSYVALTRGSHVSVDYFVRMLPQRGKRVVTLIGNVLILVFLVAVIRGSITLISETSGTESSAAGYPVPLFFASIAGGALGMLVETLCQIRALFHGRSCQCDDRGAGEEAE